MDQKNLLIKSNELRGNHYVCIVVKNQDFIGFERNWQLYQTETSSIDSSNFHQQGGYSFELQSVCQLLIVAFCL